MGKLLFGRQTGKSQYKKALYYWHLQEADKLSDRLNKNPNWIARRVYGRVS